MQGRIKKAIPRGPKRKVHAGSFPLRFPSRMREKTPKRAPPEVEGGNLQYKPQEGGGRERYT